MVFNVFQKKRINRKIYRKRYSTACRYSIRSIYSLSNHMCYKRHKILLFLNRSHKKYSLSKFQGPRIKSTICISSYLNSKSQGRGKREIERDRKTEGYLPFDWRNTTGFIQYGQSNAILIQKYSKVLLSQIPRPSML